ncbi:FtsX-like permease family protein [Streptococcus macacae]|uniref:Efflux ABC transporter, permease protein n=1 Tax=Streptococcus macacae NCTC 11558 TaxID=764298 RepID=G5JVX6_9STRE|nr:FtsX-like permease family protein [Streptococcus macacae]EHJ52292.1 efflux ABC transporter, permease protein [Streptococcus macacae NCTC 11558]SUN78968.1 ABC transporter permease [Streptococcus macacae NCTC 11558]
MSKKIYWKDIRQSFSSSKGRFFSIFSLMAIGALALIGLKVTPPNMQNTAQDFIDKYHTMDLAVLSDYGFSKDDKKELSSIKNARIEYGRLSDVTIGKGKKAVRIFSAPNKISNYKLVSGKMPKSDKEIALASSMKKNYKIGDYITFTQSSEQKLLKTNRYKIVGFVDSSEIWDKDTIGSSSVGYGELTGYAVVRPKAFKSKNDMIARIRYNDTKNLHYDTNSYKKKVAQHQEKLEKLVSDNGKKRLQTIKSQAQEKINKAKTRVAASEKELEDAQAKIDQQTAQLQAAGLPATSPQGQAIAQAQALLNQQKAQALPKLAQTKADLSRSQRNLDHLESPSYTVYSRSTFPGGEGYQNYLNSTHSISAIGNIFPVVLYLVAAMVTLTTMTRFVDEERTNAGIFKALGYTDKQIVAKFVIYGLVAGVSGTVIGILLGNFVLSPRIGNITTGTSVIGKSTIYFHPYYTVLALVLVLVFAVLPAYLVAKRELVEKPAQLLLPKPPVSGSKIFLERLTFIWNRLTFTHKVTARNIFRYKQRMLMTIFGVAGSVALLFAGLGIQSSINGIATKQFGNILRYDMIVADNNQASAKQKAEVNSLLKNTKINDFSSVEYESNQQKIKGRAEREEVTTLISDPKKLSRFVHLQERSSGKRLKLNQSGVIITEKLAKLYKVKPGGYISIRLDEKNYKVKVSAISELYAGHFVFMSTDYYHTLTHQSYQANAHFVSLKTNSTSNIQDMSAQFMKLDGVKGVVQNNSLIGRINTVSRSLQSVMLILIILSVLLAVVILYNLTNINVAERIRELSTIKVLGFHNKEVTLYIYRETIILSLIGIITGLIGGFALHRLILSLMGGNSIMFNPSVQIYVYWVPVIAIILILAVLGWVVNHRLRQVDMLEALKSVE